MVKISDSSELETIIMVGDRVLIKPKSENDRTDSGLYLPPGVKEKEKIHTGYVIKAGPGYPIPAIAESDEPWKDQQDDVKYVPIQPREGDLAVYLQNGAYQVQFREEKYVIVPQTAILMLVRDDELLR